MRRTPGSWRCFRKFVNRFPRFPESPDERSFAMDMTGQHTIPAPRQTVWEALNDPDVLK